MKTIKKTINKMPNSVDTERNILASILIDPECFMEVNSILMPKHFYDEINQTIFENLVEMDAEGIPIDRVSLYEFLKKKKLIDTIDTTMISQIADGLSASKNVRYYSRLVLEKFLLRQIIINCRKIEQRAQNEKDQDVFQFLSEAEGAFNKINSDIDFVDERKELSLGEIVFNTIAEIREERDSGKRNRGMAFTDFPSLNKQIGGIMPGDLIGLFGREKTTKSTLAFSLMLDLGLQDVASAYFSYEMGRESLVRKSLSLTSGINYNKLRNPLGYSSSTRITDEELEKTETAAKKLQKVNMVIYDAPLNEYQIAATLKKLIKRNGLKIAVIDYILLVNSGDKFNNPREELNHLTKYFKRLAMQLKIGIIVISQANYEGGRVAEGLGLQRDSDYFFYIERKDPGSSIKLRDTTNNTEYTYTFEQDQYLVTLRGSRHSVSNRSFVVQYVDNKYSEVDTFNGVSVDNQQSTMKDRHYSQVEEELI